MGRTDEFKTGLRHAGNAPAADLTHMTLGQLFDRRDQLKPGSHDEYRRISKELASRVDGGY